LSITGATHYTCHTSEVRVYRIVTGNIISWHFRGENMKNRKINRKKYDGKRKKIGKMNGK
jgi:hypothetical protein